MPLLLPVIFFFAAADSPAASAKVWTGKELSTELAAAKPDANKVTQTSLGKYAGYSMSVTRREANGIGELHQSVTDIFVIQSGECTLVLGGKLIHPRNQSPGEVRGSGIDGGEKHHVSTGDVVRIPAKTAHQMLLDPGQSVVYAVVKVSTK